MVRRGAPLGSEMETWKRFKSRFRENRTARRLVNLQWQVRVIRRRLTNSSRLAPWDKQPFNGQIRRRETIDKMIDAYRPDVLIETGSHLGDTTRYLATKGHVYSSEIKYGFYWMARWAVRNLDVELVRGDSATAIAHLAGRGFERPFAYLDAHWWAALPLIDEVRLLTSLWESAIIVIDDVQVPGDDGYAFGSYEGEPLSLNMLTLPDSAVVRYPSVSSEEETGARSGTLYIGYGAGADVLESLQLRETCK